MITNIYFSTFGQQKQKMNNYSLSRIKIKENKLGNSIDVKF